MSKDYGGAAIGFASTDGNFSGGVTFVPGSNDGADFAVPPVLPPALVGGVRQAVTPPIGFDRLTTGASGNKSQWNGDIGAGLNLVNGNTVGTNQVPIGTDGKPTDGSSLRAYSPGELGVDENGAPMTWCNCVAGTTQGVTGTITTGVFVAGAGSSVSKGVIPANGYGWVKN